LLSLMTLESFIEKLAFSRCHLMDGALQSLNCLPTISI
jgi:hypothetical protein